MRFFGKSINKNLSLTAAAVASVLILNSCAADSGTTSGKNSTSEEIQGDITFLTNRTDLVTDGTFKQYFSEFNKKYPKANITVQGITDYDGDVKTRLTSPNGYGDVLMVPAGIPADEYQNYFEPLGKTADLASTYRFLPPLSVEGTQYGIAWGGLAFGVVYNTKIFQDAGITKLPTSPDEFLIALKSIKDKTSAIPMYTNYKDGWPLAWEGLIGALSDNPNAKNQLMENKTPWTIGTDIYTLDSFLFDVVKGGLTEPDPVTTNWEQSKGDLATGKIATMVLGSWAIIQMQDAAKKAGLSPNTIGFMAFPSNVDGKQTTTVAGDRGLAINKNSKNKAVAHALVDWLLSESGYTASQGLPSAVKSAPIPTALKSLSDNGVKLIEITPPTAGNESLLQNISDASKIDILGFVYRQKLVDIARGQAAGDKQSYFAQLNNAWGTAVAKVG